MVGAARRSAASGAAPALSAAPGPLSKVALRVGHTGARATSDEVLDAVLALGRGLQSLGWECDVDAAISAVLGDS